MKRAFILGGLLLVTIVSVGAAHAASAVDEGQGQATNVTITRDASAGERQFVQPGDPPRGRTLGTAPIRQGHSTSAAATPPHCRSACLGRS